MSWLNLIAPIISPITDIFKKKEERKLAKESAQATLSLAKQNGQQEVTLTDAQWEAIQASNQNGTWKDELITVVFLSPIILILIGAIYLSFTGDSRLLDGTIQGINSLQELGLDFDFLTTAVVLAGLGLKMWRKS